MLDFGGEESCRDIVISFSFPERTGSRDVGKSETDRKKGKYPGG